MLVTLPGRVRSRNQLGQLARTGNRGLRASRHHGTGNASRVTLFAIGEEDIGKLAFAHLGQPLGGRAAARGVHAHVERTVIHEAEATRGIVQLRRRHTQIRQNARDATEQAALLKLLAQRGEGLVNDLEAGIALRQRLTLGDRQRILVKRDQPALLAQLRQQMTAVAATTEGGVDIAALRVHHDGGNRFFEQDGEVLEARHGQSARVSIACASSAAEKSAARICACRASQAALCQISHFLP